VEAASLAIEFCMRAAMWGSVPHAAVVRMRVLWVNRIKPTGTSVLSEVSWRALELWLLVRGLPLATRALIVGSESIGTSM